MTHAAHHAEMSLRGTAGKGASRAGMLVAVALALGACGGDLNPVRDVAVAVGAGPKAVQRPDFVESSRPDRLEYRPVGVAPPPRTSAARPAEGVRQMEAEMDALRAANEARAAEARAAGEAAPKP